MSTMRDDVLAFIADNLVDEYIVSEELPHIKDGDPLYFSEFETIFVSQTQTTQEPLFRTLDGTGAVTETNTVSIYFVNDAKTLPSGYDEQVELLKQARLLSSFIGATSRTVLKSTEEVADYLVTQLDISYDVTITDT